MPTIPTRRYAFLAALTAAPILVPSLAVAQAPAPQAATPSAPAAAPAPAAASAASPAPSDAKSLEVLAEVRKAIGGDAKIAALKTASFEGTYRRVMGEQDMNGDLELYFALPDKFQRVEQFRVRRQPHRPAHRADVQRDRRLDGRRSAPPPAARSASAAPAAPVAPAAVLGVPVAAPEARAADPAAKGAASTRR